MLSAGSPDGSVPDPVIDNVPEPVEAAGIERLATVVPAFTVDVCGALPTVIVRDDGTDGAIAIELFVPQPLALARANAQMAISKRLRTIASSDAVRVTVGGSAHLLPTTK